MVWFVDCTRTSGDAKVVAELLDRSPGLVDVKFGDGSRPLHAAAMWGYDRIVDLLIERGADVNARDRLWRRPLHWAATNGHRKVCELLLAAGADVNAKDRHGETPLGAAEGFVKENARKVRGVLKKWGGKRVKG